MTQITQTPHRLFRWPFFCFLALSVLVIALAPKLPAGAQQKQAGYKVELEAGKTARSSLTIKNPCIQPHRFRVKTGSKYVRFDGAADSILVPGGSSQTLGLSFDTTGLRPKVYEDDLLIECLDCKPDKTCTEIRQRVPVELTVTKPATPKSSVSSQTPKVSIRLRLRWHGIDKPGVAGGGGGGGGGGGCDQPLGICLTTGFSIASGSLTNALVDEGFGTASFQVDGDRLHMIFDRQAALPDGTIPIDRDYSLRPDVADALGYDFVRLLAGVYKVDMSKERFGEVFVSIVKGLPVPVGSNAAALPSIERFRPRCYCKISIDDITGIREGPTGVIWDLTGGIDVTYPRQSDDNQDDCERICRDAAFSLDKQSIATKACAANAANGTLVRAYALVGNRSEGYQGAQDIGILINTPEVSKTVCTCPPTWVANPSNEDGGVTTDGKCKKGACGPIHILPLPPNGTAVGTWGFVWDRELIAWGTKENGGAANCVTTILSPAVCKFQ